MTFPGCVSYSNISRLEISLGYWTYKCLMLMYYYFEITANLSRKVVFILFLMERHNNSFEN